MCLTVLRFLSYIFALLLVCFAAHGTNVQFLLTDSQYGISRTTNALVTVQAENIGQNGITLLPLKLQQSTDATGQTTFTNLFGSSIAGFYHWTVAIANSSQRVQGDMWVSSTNLGTVTESFIDIVNGAPTYPNGTWAWSAQASDLRYSQSTNIIANFVTQSQLNNASNILVAFIIATNGAILTVATNLYYQSGLNATNLATALTNDVSTVGLANTNLSYLIGAAGSNNVAKVGLANTNLSYLIGLGNTNYTFTATNNQSISNGLMAFQPTNVWATFNYVTNAIVVTSNALSSVSVTASNAIPITNGTGYVTTLNGASVLTGRTIQTTNITLLDSNSTAGYIIFPHGDIIQEYNQGFNQANDTGIYIGIGGQLLLYESFSFVAGATNDIGGYLASAPIIGSSIPGGVKNLIGFSSINPSFSQIAGGYGNSLYSPFSFIAGGSNNLSLNARFTFAAGANAKNAHDGTFVWNGYTGPNTPQFSSTGTNQVLFNAAGGMGINTNNPGTNALAVQGTGLINGDLFNLGNINLNGLPSTYQFTTNIVAIFNAGITAANGTYTNMGGKVYTNILGNGSSLNFQNPSWILQTNQVNSYSASSLAVGSVWSAIIGVSTPPNSSYGYTNNFLGQVVANFPGGVGGTATTLSNTNTVGAGIHISIVTNAVGSYAVYVISADTQTNGFFQYTNFVSNITNGLATTNYVVNATNNLEVALTNLNYSLYYPTSNPSQFTTIGIATNGIANTNFVNAQDLTASNGATRVFFFNANPSNNVIVTSASIGFNTNGMVWINHNGNSNNWLVLITTNR